MPVNKNCSVCGKHLHHVHCNTKYCKSCRQKLLKRPLSTASPALMREIKRLAGKVTRNAMAQKFGVSTVCIQRAATQMGISLLVPRYSDALKNQVLRFYESFGASATKKRFPDVRVRSVVEYSDHQPRQVRWTDKQLVQAACMAGLVSFSAQAKAFNRPKAHEGSIKALWCKRFPSSTSSTLHGLPPWHAKHILKTGYPVISVPYLGKPHVTRKLVLWVDAENWLVPETPDFLRQAVRTMAHFQRWLLQTPNPKPVILEVVRRGMLKDAAAIKEGLQA